MCDNLSRASTLPMELSVISCFFSTSKIRVASSLGETDSGFWPAPPFPEYSLSFKLLKLILEWIHLFAFLLKNIALIFQTLHESFFSSFHIRRTYKDAHGLRQFSFCFCHTVSVHLGQRRRRVNNCLFLPNSISDVAWRNRVRPPSSSLRLTALSSDVL